MTLDEAIRHCLEQARKLQDKADRVGDDESRQCMECAADHIQLAEWLMELKDLRAEQNDQYVFIHELMSELKEAKRLLKLAVEDMTEAADCGACLHDNDGKCPIEVKRCEFKWRYADEALALIGEDGERNG